MTDTAQHEAARQNRLLEAPVSSLTDQDLAQAEDAALNAIAQAHLRARQALSRVHEIHQERFARTENAAP